jgi:hypothetical protein
MERMESKQRIRLDAARSRREAAAELVVDDRRTCADDTFLRLGVGWAFYLWRQQMGEWQACFLGVGAGWNLLMGAIALVPGQAIGTWTDGGRLLMLLRNDPRGERWCAMAALAGFDQEGVRPRAWNPALVRAAIRDLDNAADSAAAAALASSWASDRKDSSAAMEYSDKAMAIVNAGEPMPPLLKTGIVLGAATVEAWYRKNPVIARSLWHCAPSVAGEPPFMRPSADAVLLYAEGQWENARRAALEALSLLRNPPVTGSEQMATERLKEILGLIDSGVESSAAMPQPSPT